MHHQNIYTKSFQNNYIYNIPTEMKLNSKPNDFSWVIYYNVSAKVNEPNPHNKWYILLIFLDSELNDEYIVFIMIMYVDFMWIFFCFMSVIAICQFRFSSTASFMVRKWNELVLWEFKSKKCFQRRQENEIFIQNWFSINLTLCFGITLKKNYHMTFSLNILYAISMHNNNF